jgi:electron transfer flavoprotein beta subunit
VKIVVCLHPPQGANPAADPPVMGGDDAHALATALGLGAGHTVTALLAGRPTEDGPLRRAASAGAVRVVRLIGEDLGSADFHTLGQALATAVKRLGADLVLTGARSDDDGLGAVPASIARHVGATAVHVACVENVTAAGEDAVEITVRGGGRRRRLRVPLPAVLSIVARGPEAPALPKATGQPPTVEVLSLVDPEATVVRRRTELLGQPELPARATEEVKSADALVAGLIR